MKTIAILSGGMDSTTLVYHLINQQHTVKALAVNYGQRHCKELDYAEAMCKRMNIEYQVADLRGIKHLIGGSSQTGDIKVPDGHYAEETMKQTVVPNRNMIMLSVAIGWAVSLKYDAVAYGAHGGDHAIYPDCRERFAGIMNSAAQNCDWHRVELIRPFIEKSKADIVTLGASLGVPFNETWSCYKGQDKHCGVCGTCVERKEAFMLADINDPTEYKE